MKRRLALVFLILTLILTACAKPAEPTTTTQPAASESTAPATTETTAPAATEPECSSKWDQFSLDILPQTPDARLSVQEVSCPEYNPETEWAKLLGCRGDVALWNFRTIVSHLGDMTPVAERDPDPMRLVLFNVCTGETLVEIKDEEVNAWDYVQLYRDDAMLLVKQDETGFQFTRLDRDGAETLFTAEAAKDMTFGSFENGDILYAYGNEDGSHGIRMFSQGTLRDVRTWGVDGTNYSGFGFETYGDSFLCTYRQGGTLIFLQVNGDGTTAEYTLTPPEEKLNDFTLTPYGMMLCVALNEETAEPGRVLALYTPDGGLYGKRLTYSDTALYSLCYGSRYGLAVNSAGKPYLFWTDGKSVSGAWLRGLLRDQTDLPEDLMSGEADVRHARDDSFYLYYPDADRMFLLTIE